ncbi:MAG: phosphate acyltransferase PlsX [Alphaproteobacteria bacterium]
MAEKFVMALDAMGGDNAPRCVVAGAAKANIRYPHIEYLFVGDELKIKPLLERHKNLLKCSHVLHTDKMVRGDDKPSVALRAGRHSSMRLALDAVAKGDAACVVSGGNTGALMAMGRMVLKTLPGIERPAIVSYFPTLHGECVLLDLGANIESDGEALFQFAVMGALFGKVVLGMLSPRIGLLNVGSEELKGHDEIRAAAALLREATLPGSYIGFVEGDNIFKGLADVVVTDGFTGNIALKTMEGTAKLCYAMLRRSFQSSLTARLGYLLAYPAMRKLKKKIDPRMYNGAMLVGLNGVCVKSHGGTDAQGFANAIGVAGDLVTHGINKNIREEMLKLYPVVTDTVASEGLAI